LAAVMKGGDDGAVVIPGKPEDSPLFQNLAVKADPHMPRRSSSPMRSAIPIREWIAALTAAPRRPAETTGARRSIPFEQAVDTLIAKLDAAQREARGGHGRRTWCRRVWLDLAGASRRPRKADEFLHAPAETKRAPLVDKLLASESTRADARALDVILMGRAKRTNQEDKPLSKRCGLPGECLPHQPPLE